MDIREKIRQTFFEVAETTEAVLVVDELEDDTILLETGLNSLGFAVLVVTLEDELGFDPFPILEEAVYPRTFLEFVDVYKKFA